MVAHALQGALFAFLFVFSTPALAGKGVNGPDRGQGLPDAGTSPTEAGDWTVTSETQPGVPTTFTWTLVPTNPDAAAISHFTVPTGCFNDGWGTYVVECWAQHGEDVETRVEDACTVGPDGSSGVFGVKYEVPGATKYGLVIGGSVEILSVDAVVKAGETPAYVSVPAPRPDEEGACNNPMEAFDCAPEDWSEWTEMVVGPYDYGPHHGWHGCHLLDQRTCDRPARKAGETGTCVVQARADKVDPNDPDRRILIAGHMVDETKAPNSQDYVLSECNYINYFPDWGSDAEGFKECAFGLVTAGLGPLGERTLAPGEPPVPYGTCPDFGFDWGYMSTTSPTCRLVGDVANDPENPQHKILQEDELLALQAAGLAYDSVGAITYECDVPCAQITEVPWYPNDVTFFEDTQYACTTRVWREQQEHTLHYQEFYDDGTGLVGGECINGETLLGASRGHVLACAGDGSTTQKIQVGGLPHVLKDSSGWTLENMTPHEAQLLELLEKGGYCLPCVPEVWTFEEAYHFDNWTVSVDSGTGAAGSATVVVEDPGPPENHALLLDIVDWGVDPDNLKIQHGIHLPAGTYTLSFRARTTAKWRQVVDYQLENEDDRALNPDLEALNGDSYTGRPMVVWVRGGVWDVFPLVNRENHQDKWTDYKMHFTHNGRRNGYTEIRMEWGWDWQNKNRPHQIWLDDIRIVPMQ